MSPSNIITIGNLADQLSRWTPNDDCHVYAIIDMGSNGIRFSITSLAPPTTRLLRPIFTRRAAISLFDALTPSPSGPVFPSSTIDSVSSALAEFHQLAVLHGVPPAQTLILATEAMRRAANAGQMLEAIARATGGLGVRILDPPVETLLGAVMGSRSDLSDVKGGALFLDLGGGSVQMTWVDTDAEDYGVQAATAGGSLPFGAAKLIRVLENDVTETQNAELQNLATSMRRLYSELCIKFPALNAIRTAYENGQESFVNVYMCGGGFRGYGSILMHNDPIRPYPIPSVSTYSVDGSVFKQTTLMREFNDRFEGKIFGMSKRRRRQFPAIANVVEAFIAAVPNIGQVTFCGGSNRQGAMMMKLPREIREANPLTVLAKISDEEAPIFDAILQTLKDALPQQLKSAHAPTVLTTPLGPVFIREIWSRLGHSDDANASFALHSAVTRDAECPGLTHLVRAMLGLTASARWGNGFGPIDQQLFDGLKGILCRRHKESFLLTQYIGAVSALLAAVIPLFPTTALQLQKAIRFESNIEEKDGKRRKIVLNIYLGKKDAERIQLDSLMKTVEKAAKEDKNFSFKTSVHISP